MKRLLRPSLLILLSVLLAVGAAVLVLGDRSGDAAPLPLGENDQEIVWLYPAVSAANWERFVTAVNTAAEQLAADHSDLRVQITEKAFPPQTTAVPELALSVRRGAGRLVFRWYKLTSDLKTEQWVEKLVGGPRRPPLAVIGGASSDQAIELAQSLNDSAGRSGAAAPPLLILTTATADETQPLVSVPGQGAATGPGKLLTHLYRGRTCRFCFTNRQMARAVAGFIWSRDELRPDTDPVYMAVWEDDSYSRDLIGQFSDALRQPALTLAAAPEHWAGLLAGGCAGALLTETRLISRWIDFSVGGFDQPNRWEAQVAAELMSIKLRDHPKQEQPLLVLPAAASGPARRFLRGMMRVAPAEARRFVVATGDGLSFNTIYRDRNIAWPIQDLPFDLVFFCHRNPVDARARPAGSSSGTEDLLLYVDIVRAVVLAAYQGEDLPRSGDELRRRLGEARWKDGGVSFAPDGALLFDADGNRRTGTGEHVVWLFPNIEGEQVLPRATIRVWSWPTWKKEADAQIDVEYEPSLGR
jgi:hypothetical protein